MKTLVVAAALMLGACGFTPEGEAIRMAVKSYGARAADGELQNIEFVLCNGISVGAFKRRYGQNPEKAKAWRTLCESAPESPVTEK